MLYDTQKFRNGYTAEQMQAYGQACRAAALEEAAMAAENGFKYALDGYQIADKIRSLK
jgi:hypothetical protein